MSGKEQSNGGAVGEAINTDIITLTRFLTEEQAKHKEATGDFTYGSLHNLRVTAMLISHVDYSATLCSSHSRAYRTTSDAPP